MKPTPTTCKAPTARKATISKKDVLIFAPVLASELKDMLLQWVSDVKGAGFDNIILVFNGPGAEIACRALRKEVSSSIRIDWLSGPSSIGSCQTIVTQLFLQSNLRLLVRIDADLQFSVSDIERLLNPFAGTGRSDVVIAQRDEASVGGRMRFLGNALLRLFGQLFGIFADPNCGLYVLNRKAAAVLCRVPLPVYPEPRMLTTFRQASLTVTTRVVPILPRRTGRSSIKNFLHGIKVFIGSILEMTSWDSL